MRSHLARLEAECAALQNEAAQSHDQAVPPQVYAAFPPPQVYAAPQQPVQLLQEQQLGAPALHPSAQPPPLPPLPPAPCAVYVAPPEQRWQTPSRLSVLEAQHEKLLQHITALQTPRQATAEADSAGGGVAIDLVSDERAVILPPSSGPTAQDSARSSARGLPMEAEEMRRRLTATEKNRDDLSSSVLVLQSDLELLKAERDDFTRQAEDTMASIQEELVVERAERKEIEGENEGLRAQTSELARQLEAERSRSKPSGLSGPLPEELANLRARADELSLENEHLVSMDAERERVIASLRSILEEERKRVRGLRTELDAARLESDSALENARLEADKEVEASRRQVRSLQAEAEQALSDRNQLEQEMEAQRRRLDEQLARGREYQQELEAVQARGSEAIAAQRRQTMRVNDEKQGELARVEGERDRLQSENTNLSIRVREQDKARLQAEKDTDASHVELADLRQRLAKFEDEAANRKAAEEEVVRVKSQMDKMRRKSMASLEQMQEKADSDAQALKNNLELAQAQAAHHRREADELKEHFEQVQPPRNKAVSLSEETELESMRRDLAAARQDADRQRQHGQAQGRALDEALARAQRLEAELEAVRGPGGAGGDDDARAELAEARADIGRLREEGASNQNSAEEARRNVDRLETELRGAEEMATSRAELLQQREREVDRLQRENEEIKSDIERLRRDLLEREAESKELQRIRGELAAEKKDTEALREDIKQVEHLSKLAKDEVKTQQGIAKQRQEALMAANWEKAQLQKQLDNTSQELELARNPVIQRLPSGRGSKAFQQEPEPPVVALQDASDVGDVDIVDLGEMSPLGPPVEVTREIMPPARPSETAGGERKVTSDDDDDDVLVVDLNASEDDEIMHHEHSQHSQRGSQSQSVSQAAVEAPAAEARYSQGASRRLSGFGSGLAAQPSPSDAGSTRATPREGAAFGRRGTTGGGGSRKWSMARPSLRRARTSVLSNSGNPSPRDVSQGEPSPR